MDLSTIIDIITCPISAEVMRDPVQGNDGHTYERASIMQALSIKKESPITREPMTEQDIKVNASIIYLCDKYHKDGVENLNKNKGEVHISEYNIKLNHNLSTV